MKQQRQAERVVHELLTDLKSCSIKRDLYWGRKLHAKAVENRNVSHMYVAMALIKMYAKCGSMAGARQVFDSIEKQDVLSWTALLLGYAENGEGHVALELFSKMKTMHGCVADSVTYVAALKACMSLAVNGDSIKKVDCLERGKAIHSEIGCHLDHYVQSTLIDMYSKCGSMTDALIVFGSTQNPNVASWNALIFGYTENGEGNIALDFFSRMKVCVANSVTYVAALKACTLLALNGDASGKGECLRRGKEIHSEIGHQMNLFVQNTLINMYAKCGSMVDARLVFESIKKPDVVSWTALLLGYAENKEGHTALDLFSRMKMVCTPNSVTYVAALKACTSLVDGRGKEECLERGRAIHLGISCHLDQFVKSTLIDMYGKCGSMVDARRVFQSVKKPDVVSWNTLILGYVENGDALTALDLFSRMKELECRPNSVTYIAALKACTFLAVNGDCSGKGDYLERGKEIHLEIGSHSDHYLQSTLIDMYAKCGNMSEAHGVFDSIQEPNVVSWTALILGYAENGEGLTALDLFSRMKGTTGCAPNSVTYISAFKACTSLAVDGDDIGKADCLKRGKEIHSVIGNHLNHYVQNTLIDMYANCGSMVDAHLVFDSIQEADVVSWNALIMGYVENGEGHTALDLLSKMNSAGDCVPNAVTYIAALRACGLIGALALGRKFHSDIREFTAHVVTCLVDFYAKCGSMVEACEVFDLHPKLRVISTWNALLAGYSSFGDPDSVFNHFEAMQDQGFRPDAVTFVCVLLCCSHAGLVEKARQYFDAMPVHYGVTPAVIHYNCMVDVLGRANQLKEAIAVLRQMPYNPTPVTWITLLDACRRLKNVEIGKWALQSLVDMDTKNASTHVLMAPEMW